MTPVFRIFTCNEWGAYAPAHPPTAAGNPDKIIYHHTYGHAPNLDANPTQTLDEAKAYARQIQKQHMGTNGWNDSGHSFLVTRGGYILEGRHGTVAAIEKGRMVVSAHCPGQNDQPGIEHEHYKEPAMTEAQRAATVWLHAWICRCTGIRPTEIYPHSRFYATACPAELGGEIMALRLAVAHELTVNPEEQNARRLATLRAWILGKRAAGWTWEQIKSTSNWAEFKRRGGR